jgi:hypothetical protein
MQQRLHAALRTRPARVTGMRLIRPSVTIPTSSPSLSSAGKPLMRFWSIKRMAFRTGSSTPIQMTFGVITSLTPMVVFLI